MALLQDKTQETLIQTAHTCTPKVYRHSRSCHTHSHTLSSFRKSARKFILCFWCPSLFRDLLPLPEEPLMLRCFPEIMWFLRTQPYTKCWKKNKKTTRSTCCFHETVWPGESRWNSDPALSSPDKSPSAIKNLERLKQDIWASRWFT